jgi:hypothetical protein
MATEKRAKVQHDVADFCMLFSQLSSDFHAVFDSRSSSILSVM